MSLAEEMLANVEEGQGMARTAMPETEGRIVVGEDRRITVPPELRTIAVVGDKDVETVTIECIRYWDGNDLSTFAFYLNYVLPNGTLGTYIPTTVGVDYDKIVFDWEIGSEFTRASGTLSFAITALLSEGNTSSTAKILKQWGTLPNSDMTIASGIGISDIPEEDIADSNLTYLGMLVSYIQRLEFFSGDGEGSLSFNSSFNRANGDYSSAFGYGTNADNKYQFVVGSYNEQNEDDLFVVGDGSYNNRHTAFSVQKDQYGYYGIRVGDTILTEDDIIAIQAYICLQAGTTILMADRTYKAIEDVKYGDMIMSYDFDTNELIPCKSFGCLPTGYAHSWNHYCFDNGSVLKIFGSHRIYNAKKRALVYSSKMSIGDKTISSKCEEATYCYSPKKVPAAVSTRKYTLFCETGLYFANDILCGHPICQPLDFHIRTHGAVKLSEEDKELLQSYANARDNEYLVEMQNPEYVKEAMPFWKARETASKKIKSSKEKLANRDYKTIKAMQGKLTQDEIDENIVACDELRSKINDNEVVVAENDERIKVLQDRHNVHPRPLQFIEDSNIRSAIARARQKYAK